MSGAVLAPVRWPDVPALVSLEKEIYGPDAWSEAAWWSELAARPRRAYVTVRLEAPERFEGSDGLDARGAPGGGEIVGYAGLDLGPDVADVMTVTLAERARRARLGHTLMRWLVGTAAATPAESIMLEVRSDNEAATTLYSRWGFRQISARRDYYHGADALILRRDITADDRAAGAGAGGRTIEETR